jgi:hypothetical protein
VPRQASDQASTTTVRSAHLDSLPSTGATVEDVLDLRRTLYGLDAILRLHNAQEAELYDWIGQPQPGPIAART